MDIHAAHVIHRDLKPETVMLRVDGRVLAIDFGSAGAMGDTQLTRTGQHVGSVGYMAPERLKGGPGTAASDVFALGAVGGHADLHGVTRGHRIWQHDAVLVDSRRRPWDTHPADVRGPHVPTPGRDAVPISDVDDTDVALAWLTERTGTTSSS